MTNLNVTTLKRWRCGDCSKVSNQAALLSAPNPFDPNDTVTGCPWCKSVADFEELCDEPGCEREAGCGFPTSDGGYRRTCSAHSIWARPAAPLPTTEEQK